MTGFGKQVVQLATKKITVELKSLNSKHLDIHLRMPQAYREKELEWRKTIANTLKRGKIDVALYIEITGQETAVTINSGVVKNYMEQLSHMAQANPAQLLKMALSLPDTLKTDKDAIDQTEYKAITQALQQALTHLVAFRTAEGKVLEKEFGTRLHNLRLLLQQVETLDTERLNAIRERLERAVATLKTEVDTNRFEQELIYYLEKYDITEEKVRLANHLNFFQATLQETQSQGKKLGFIAQEMGREINTLGAKANHAPLQQVVVAMKDELEKIKEQMLNIL